ncbi:molybdenum cofactor guanylyltransferase [Sphingomonas sp. Leaf4]|uniref:molybdenum cofactor guanylyltransferase n=1 Tax=Sphingomonas sp. Leaf4 TaxID=2876553 RepID=UPI002E77E740|nr:molybdenum cofactor guanylyltransferase [Sphingomonas sp. Leaf4]
MRVLGAIIAGGQASRFGSDKALAVLDGRALIDRVADALAPQVDTVVVVGRDHGTLASVPDRPAPGLGPLGGIAGALHHAAAQGFTHVLTVPCDAPFLPKNLRELLNAAPLPEREGSGVGRPVAGGAFPHQPTHPQLLPSREGSAAYLADLPVIGWWPATALPALDTLLAGTGSRSVRAFGDRIGATAVAAPAIANVNTADDLARLAQHD